MDHCIDNLIEQSATAYDDSAGGRPWLSTSLQRKANATSNDTGALSASTARVTYAVTWYDSPLGRPTKSVSYGANGGNVLDEQTDDFDPATQDVQAYAAGGPAVNTSAAFVVFITEYDSQGRAYQSTDNAGKVNPTTYAVRNSSSFDWSLGHQGLWHDGESGLVENRNRTLHVAIGRFIQRDPIGYPDGMAAYEYVRGRPLLNTDPRGTIKTSAGLVGCTQTCFGVELPRVITGVLCTCPDTYLGAGNDIGSASGPCCAFNTTQPGHSVCVLVWVTALVSPHGCACFAAPVL